MHLENVVGDRVFVSTRFYYLVHSVSIIHNKSINSYLEEIIEYKQLPRGDNPVPEGQLLVDLCPEVYSHVVQPISTPSQDSSENTH